MPLVQVLMVLVVVGVLLWLVNRFIPMQGTIKSILLERDRRHRCSVFGLFHNLSKIRVGN